jgi:Cytochrome C oxidase, cbb3-type, subunit III
MPYNRLFYTYILIGFFSMIACKNEPSLKPLDKEPETPKVVTDTCGGLKNMTYNNKIEAIFKSYCTGCHGDNTSARGYNFEGYFNVKVWMKSDSARILGVIRHEVGYFMPPNGKVPDCQIRQLETWLREGLKEN